MDLLLQYALVNDMEEMALLKDKEDARKLAATLLAGVELAQQDSQLLPDPHCNTPWQLLYESQNDHAFITTMGIDTQTFELILTSGFASQWYQKPITCPDINSHGIPCLNRCSLNAGGALGLILHYLNSTMQETSLQQIFALIPSTVSRYLTSGLPMLLQTLCSMADARIQWPQGPAFECIDGLKLPVQTSEDDEIENATYNGWLSEHFITEARINAPGSWHDSHLASHIYTQLQLHTPANYYIVADTAFPCGMSSIDECIHAPLKHGQILCGSAAEMVEQMAFNCELLSYHQTAEWGMQAIQGAFGRLCLPLNITNKEAHSNLIEVCLWLHNLCATHIGTNQIRTVYMKLWQATEDDMDVWQDFENMLFSEQRKKDQVSCFHVILQYQ
ncbi:hypothetical protein BDR04DRAFT_1212289 [Suillus decipiens]|nr:hypothetical protein BDR04DRAFT_1212289 [Suillus decipiens]